MNKIIRGLDSTIDNDNKKLLINCLFFTFLFGLLAYAFIFFNPSFSHDSLAITQEFDDRWQISLGRFMQPIYRMIRGYVTAPWLLGFLSLIFIAFAVYFIIKIFEIQNKYSLIIICGLLATNTTLTFLYATFAPWGDVHALAFLLSVCSVYFWLKYKYGFLLGAILLGISLALYQNYTTCHSTRYNIYDQVLAQRRKNQ